MNALLPAISGVSITFLSACLLYPSIITATTTGNTRTTASGAGILGQGYKKCPEEVAEDVGAVAEGASVAEEASVARAPSRQWASHSRISRTCLGRLMPCILCVYFACCFGVMLTMKMAFSQWTRSQCSQSILRRRSASPSCKQDLPPAFASRHTTLLSPQNLQVCSSTCACSWHVDCAQV